MSDFFQNSVFFGVLISLISYGLGVWMKKRFKLAVLNPLLIAVVLTAAAVLLLKLDYESYSAGAQSLSYLLTPATVCLAVPLYKELSLLRKNYRAVLVGIFSGVVTSLVSIFVLAKLFSLGHDLYVTLLPKSITTAIGIGISEELGGYVPVTVAVIIITGILGSIIAERLCRLFRIEEPIAKGVAVGTSSHAVGTAKAMEMGQTEGAVSALSIVISGILTVVGASLFAQFI